MKWFTLSMLGAGFALAAVGERQAASRPLVVHEWGTITTRHAPDGTPEGRLNRIRESEALPDFVHRFEPPPTRVDPEKSLLKMAIGPGRPDVTMRLETPVIYFHPAPAGDSLPPFDVSVTFRGGVINEFYPNAQASVELDTARANVRVAQLGRWDGETMNNFVTGGLRWHQVALNGNAAIPATTSHVWLAPRAVATTPVTTRGGEGERYLFYRGVAHLDALMQTALSPTELRLRAPQHLEWMPAPTMSIGKLWFAGIRTDGQAAFREHGPVTIDRDAPSAELARFAVPAAAEYGPSGLSELRASMKVALVAAGLFDDEADAMLETWKESYFRNPGLRVFYIVPREWTSYYLPLTISTPHTLTRVIVGRIDLKEQ